MQELHDRLMNDCKTRFPYYLDKFGRDKLIELLSPETFNSFYSEYTARLEEKNKFHYRTQGSVLDRAVAAPEGYQSSNGFYPLSHLIQGVQWPEGIDPAKRETYLSPEEFLMVFKMTKEEFQAKDKFKRMELKKLHKLF